MTKIEWNNKNLTTTQEAYIDLYRNYIDAPNLDAYKAHATDDEGNEYMIFWEILNDSDDESERCDWLNPIEVRKL